MKCSLQKWESEATKTNRSFSLYTDETTYERVCSWLSTEFKKAQWQTEACSGESNQGSVVLETTTLEIYAVKAMFLHLRRYEDRAPP